MRAATVSVGNEILFGETVDTNAAWLARTLTGWGIEVVAALATRDVVPEIQGSLTRAMESADVVIVSGGLGPTSDDVTKGAVAQLLGLQLVVDEEVAREVRDRFSAAGFDDVPPFSTGQSEIPAGSTPLVNTRGTAPGLLLQHEGTTVVMLPGVPHEMKGIVSGPLRDEWLASGLISEGASHRVIHTSGIEEPRLAERVEEAIERLPVDVREHVGWAFLPDELGVDLRLTVVAADRDRAGELLDAFETGIDAAVHPWRFEADGGDIVEAVSALLASGRRTVSTAESCTGGLVAKRLTDRAGSSDVFHGGIVAYENSVKIGQLGVSADDIARHGAVSEAVAGQMALGVSERMGTDAGIGITGVAGPGGGTPEKPVGTVWIAASVGSRVEARLHHMPGDRGEIRRRAAQAALVLLYRLLLEIDSGA